MSLAYQIYDRETKRKGKVYDIVFRIETADGARQKRLYGFATKKQAKQAHEEFMRTYVAPPHRLLKDEQLLFISAYTQYIAYITHNLKQSSVYDITHAFQKHILPTFAEKNLAELNKDDIYAWQDAMWSMRKPNGELYSISRLSSLRNKLHAFIVWCTKRYGIPDCFSGVDKPKRKAQKRTYTVWSRDDFNKFIACIDEPLYYALFYTLFYSGMRIGELQALTPECFDGECLTIKQTFSRKTIDGSPYVILDTKNYTPHIIPLPEHACAVLQDWLAYKAKNKLPNKYIFGGAHPISNHAIENAKDKAVALSGVQRIRLHDFRHSYVSNLISNGVNLTVVAKLVGDTLEQVVETYAHFIDADVKNAVKNL